MTRTARAAAAIVSLALAALAPPAAADTPPNAWDRAKDPAARDAYEIHLEVRPLLFRAPIASDRDYTRNLERARAILEDADAAHSSDVRLRFDLGEVYEGLGRHAQALAVLQAALAIAPDHTAAEQAWLDLAYALAHLDRPREERAAYEQFLARSTSEYSRAIAVLNLAEADMRLGDLDDAIAGYRQAVQLSAALPNDAKTGILATWGLAVALDRAGDPQGSAVEARLAVGMDSSDQIIGDRVGVFFVPAYERLWYLALGSAERARQAADARTALAFWQRTESLWASYVAQADPKDRWARLARAHLDRARTERALAEKRAGGKARSHDLPPGVELHF